MGERNDQNFRTPSRNEIEAEPNVGECILNIALTHSGDIRTSAVTPIPGNTKPYVIAARQHEKLKTYLRSVKDVEAQQFRCRVVPEHPSIARLLQRACLVEIVETMPQREWSIQMINAKPALVAIRGGVVEKIIHAAGYKSNPGLSVQDTKQFTEWGFGDIAQRFNGLCEEHFEEKALTFEAQVAEWRELVVHAIERLPKGSGSIQDITIPIPGGRVEVYLSPEGVYDKGDVLYVGEYGSIQSSKYFSFNPPIPLNEVPVDVASPRAFIDQMTRAGFDAPTVSDIDNAKYGTITIQWKGPDERKSINKTFSCEVLQNEGLLRTSDLSVHSNGAGQPPVIGFSLTIDFGSVAQMRPETTWIAVGTMPRICLPEQARIFQLPSIQKGYIYNHKFPEQAAIARKRIEAAIEDSAFIERFTQSLDRHANPVIAQYVLIKKIIEAQDLRQIEQRTVREMGSASRDGYHRPQESLVNKKFIGKSNIVFDEKYPDPWEGSNAHLRSMTQKNLETQKADIHSFFETLQSKGLLFAAQGSGTSVDDKLMIEYQPPVAVSMENSEYLRSESVIGSIIDVLRKREQRITTALRLLEESAPASAFEVLQEGGPLDNDPLMMSTEPALPPVKKDRPSVNVSALEAVFGKVSPSPQKPQPTTPTRPTEKRPEPAKAHIEKVEPATEEQRKLIQRSAQYVRSLLGIGRSFGAPSADAARPSARDRALSNIERVAIAAKTALKEIDDLIKAPNARYDSLQGKVAAVKLKVENVLLDNAPILDKGLTPVALSAYEAIWTSAPDAIDQNDDATYYITEGLTTKEVILKALRDGVLDAAKHGLSIEQLLSQIISQL